MQIDALPKARRSAPARPTLVGCAKATLAAVAVVIGRQGVAARPLDILELGGPSRLPLQFNYNGDGHDLGTVPCAGVTNYNTNGPGGSTSHTTYNSACSGSANVNINSGRRLSEARAAQLARQLEALQA